MKCRFPNVLTVLALVVVLASCGESPLTNVATQAAATYIPATRISTSIPATPTIATALPVTPTLNAPTASSDTTPESTLSQGLIANVDVGGHKLHIVCGGQGSPTVIFEAGMDSPSSDWNTILLALRKNTRVCAYDRAGLGESDVLTPIRPRTSKDVAHDLHTLLANAGIAGPFVMVGHSFGGVHARVYAAEYPQDIVGLVLVDAPAPDLDEQSLAVMPAPTPNDGPDLKDYYRYLTYYRSNPLSDALNGEKTQIDVSFDQFRAAGSLGILPLVVITAGQPSWSSDFSPSLVAKLEDVRLRLQKDLVKLSSRGTQMIADQSKHLIMEHQPDVVLQAIRSVLDLTQGK